MPATPITPQDHKAKKVKRGKPPGTGEPFSFTHDGEEYTLQPADEITAGWYEDHENDSPMKMVMQQFRVLAEDDAYLAIRAMKGKEFGALTEEFNWHNGVTPGES